MQYLRTYDIHEQTWLLRLSSQNKPLVIQEREKWKRIQTCCTLQNAHGKSLFFTLAFTWGVAVTASLERSSSQDTISRDSLVNTSDLTHSASASSVCTGLVWPYKTFYNKYKKTGDIQRERSGLIRARGERRPSREDKRTPQLGGEKHSG